MAGRRTPRIALALGALALAAGCMGRESGPEGSSGSSKPGWPRELTLGFAGGVDAEAALERNKPLTDLLQRATGIPVRGFTATSYSVVVQAMRARRVDGMQVGVFSYLLAVQEARAEALAIYVSTLADPAVYDPLIRLEYYSVISVKKGRGINSLADLKGRTFNFVEPASTSGHLVPKTELLKAGLVPDRDLKTRFAGNHAASLVSLWNDSSDAAASSELSLRNAAAGKQIESCGFPDREVGRARSAAEIKAVFDACPDGRLAPLHYSFPIPGTPIAFRADLPADLKAVIKRALLSTAGDPAFIHAARRWYVDPSVEMGLPNLDAYFDRMRELAKLLDLDLRGLE